MKKLIAGLTLALLWTACDAQAQTTYGEYKFIFSGTAYQTNAAGTMVGTHITDETLLADRARLGGITNLSTISLVYHINGGSLGDTVEVISNSTSQTLTTEFGLYFGSDSELGRTAVTNLTQTQERRIDYVYTFDNSTYTYENDDSVGAAFTYKSFVNEGNVTNAVINGSISWSVIPTGSNAAPIVCVGTFSLGKPITAP